LVFFWWLLCFDPRTKDKKEKKEEPITSMKRKLSKLESTETPFQSLPKLSWSKKKVWRAKIKPCLFSLTSQQCNSI
jgi:hypothetical protein